MKPLLFKYRFFIAFYAVFAFIIPALTSTMAANHELKLRSQRIQSLLKAVEDLKHIQAAKDLSIQQKDAQSASKQAEIDRLNKELQSKKAEEVRIAAIPAPVTGGYGGNYVGNSLAWGGFFNTYAPGNCTAYVASVIHVPDSMGDARFWDDYAYGHGVVVSNMPRVGSVAQTDYGYYGHVGLVESIDGGRVLLKEANVYGLGVVDERWVGVGEYVYLYF